MKVSAEGPEQWAQVISDSFVPLALAGVSDSFRGSVEQTVLLPGVTMTGVDSRGHSVVLRTPRLTRVEPREFYLFSLQLGGAGTVLQGERRVPLAPGSGALYDATRPYRLAFPGPIREIVLQVPRPALRDLVGCGEDALYGRALPAAEPATRVLAAYLGELSGVADGLTGDQRAELGHTALGLLATALRASTGTEAPADTGRGALLSAMRAHVRDHFADPDLTAGRLAREHGVSARYTALVFAEAGTSPAAYIRDQRLRAAHRMLTDPRQRLRTIAGIAAAVGLPDRTTFTRAFTRRYGIAPSALRE
ncbi:helix-turn-helix domain-containing protein [Nocardiopsis sp. YSL2]|uniref:AraC-like ligand-binding domain-containing protein n=1 Tax=Nocardiopsis sp. YSL2 TaxID=2939492 RepID=UPI0026F476B2|nr:helix-turn-helix domain-containing protein [Nocardiopsis sp. YSL2]